MCSILRILVVIRMFYQFSLYMLYILLISVLYHITRYLVNAINLVVLCCRVVNQYHNYASNHTHENIHAKKKEGVFHWLFSPTKTGRHLSLWETNTATSGQYVSFSTRRINSNINRSSLVISYYDNTYLKCIYFYTFLNTFI